MTIDQLALTPEFLDALADVVVLIGDDIHEWAIEHNTKRDLGPEWELESFTVTREEI